MPHIDYCLHQEPEGEEFSHRYELVPNEKWHMKHEKMHVIFVEKGYVQIQLDNFPLQPVHQGDFFLLPHNRPLDIFASEPSEIFVILLPDNLSFCHCFASQALLNERKKNQLPTIGVLPYVPAIRAYLDSVSIYMHDKIACSALSEIKAKELFSIFLHYYDRPELSHFFALHLTSDNDFSETVYRHAATVKSINELAEIMNYSISGFQKHFKKVFGLPPYQWLSKYRSKIVLTAITQSSASFKQISKDFRFSSVQHLYAFSKKQYGSTPQRLRRGLDQVTNY